MATVTVIRKVAPGVTVNFIEKKSGKVVATGTANAAGDPFTITVPVGRWYEQHVRVLAEPNGPSRTFTDTGSTPLDFETGNAGNQLGPTCTSPDGSLWIIQVSNAGVLSAVKLA